jgi:hypothetical protein
MISPTAAAIPPSQATGCSAPATRPPSNGSTGKRLKRLRRKAL